MGRFRRPKRRRGVASQFAAERLLPGVNLRSEVGGRVAAARRAGQGEDPDVVRRGCRYHIYVFFGGVGVYCLPNSF